jgi:outer membrane protein TolC
MKHRLFHILLILLIAGSAFGQSLDQYLVIAAENNPNLKSGFLRYQAALERVPQVGSLPDPQLSFGFFIQPMERFAGNQRGSISVMQMFPWVGTLEAAKEEMALMAKAEFEAFNEARAMLFYEVKTTWYAMQKLNEAITITTGSVELLKTMEQIALVRFKSGGQRGPVSGGSGTYQGTRSSGTGNQGSGMGGMNMQAPNTPATTLQQNSTTAMAGMDNMTGGGNMTDVLRIQLEINELQNQLSLLHDSKKPLEARFNQLLNRQTGEPVMLTDTVVAVQAPVPLSQIPDSIRHNNPMLKMLEFEEEALIAQSKMNRKMGLPMVGLGLQYDIFQPGENSPAMMNGNNMLMPMVTVSLPLWRKKHRAAVRESEIMQQSVAGQKEDLHNQLMVSYVDAVRDFRDAERRLKLYQEQASLANQVLNLLLVQYSTAGTNFEEVLRMQQQLLDYRLQHLNAIIDGNLSVAAMERLTGR